MRELGTLVKEGAQPSVRMSASRARSDRSQLPRRHCDSIEISADLRLQQRWQLAEIGGSQRPPDPAKPSRSRQTARHTNIVPVCESATYI
jgi:hypothetical protein